MNQILRFEFSNDSINEALSRLGAFGPGGQRSSLRGAWPGRREWSPIADHLKRKVNAALPARDEAEIATLLHACEERADVHLAQAEGAVSNPLPDGLFADLDRLAHLICGRDLDIHAALPHFPRWFFLHLSALTWNATTPQEWARAKLAGIKLWNDGLSYMLRAADAAYRSRCDQIVLATTDIPPARYYVADTLTHLPLTPMMEHDLTDALAKCNYVRIKRARAAVVDGGFGEVIHALKAIIEGVRVEPDSDIKALKDPEQVWTNHLESLRLEEQWAQDNAFPTAGAVAASATPYASYGMAADLTIKLATGLIGSLPIPGAGLISAGAGLYLRWLMPGATTDWARIRGELERKLRVLLTEAEAHYIRQAVGVADEALERFLTQFVTERGAALAEGEPLIGGYLASLTSAVEHCYSAKPKILDPFTGRMSSLPYIENWFCTMALGLAQFARNPVPGRDAHRELRQIFDEVNDYFVRLDNECYQEQQRDNITGLYKSSDCCGDYVQTRHWTKPRNWEWTGAQYEYYGTSSLGYLYPSQERIYVFERANIVTYAKLAVATIIQNVSTVMVACNPTGWDRRTPKSVYETTTLPRNYRRRVDAWNALVDFRKRTNFWKPVWGGLEPQDDPESSYRDPSRLPTTVVNP